jgi:hypothetical protein
MPTAEDVGAATPAYVKRANPYNYLDNSDFRNPVNQRGFTSEGNGSYFIDRWVGYKVIVGSNGLTFNVSTDINAHIVQKIEPKLSARLAGKVVTLAAMFNDEVQTYSFVYETSGGNSGNGKGLLKQFVNGLMEIGFARADGGTLQWMALYEGEYTAETLPEYHPKGFAHELMECQRYYWQSYTSNPGNSNVWFYADDQGSGSIHDCTYPVTMRKTPTITVMELIDCYNNDTRLTPTAIVNYGDAHGVRAMSFAGVTLTKGNYYRMAITASAEL